MSKSIGRRDSSSSLSEQSGSLDNSSDENIKDTKEKRNNAQTPTNKKSEQPAKPVLKQAEKKSKTTDIKKNPGFNLKALFTEGLKIGPLSPRQTGKSAAQAQDPGTERSATTREKVTFTDILKKSLDHPVSSPQEVARVIIAAESNEGKIPLTKSALDTMFRSRQKTYQGKPVGEFYRIPFLKSCFLTPNFITIVQEMQENYVSMKEAGGSSPGSLKEKAENIRLANNNDINSVLNHKAIMEDFSQITKPLYAKINGSESNISTSLLPARFLHFLLELDREIVRWHQQTPDGPEKLNDIELRNIRQAALANYLGIHGPYPTIKLAAAEVKSEKRIVEEENPYVVLENVLSKKVSETFEKFLSSVIDCEEEKYSKIKDRSNKEQEIIAKNIEDRRMKSVNQSDSRYTQSTPRDNVQSTSSTTTTTTTNTTATTTTTAATRATTTTTTTTATKKSGKGTSDTAGKLKNDPRRSPAKLAAAAVNGVKESKINKKEDIGLPKVTKPSLTSLQQVFRDNVIVDGKEVFKEFIVPYMVSNLRQTKAVSLGSTMYAEFSDALDEYNSLTEKALNQKQKGENSARLAADKRAKGSVREADALVAESESFFASAKVFEERARALFIPIVTPLLDYFSPKNLQNILSEQLLDFLALCDKELSDWMRAESEDMTPDQMLQIRIRGLTGLLMNRGIGPLLQDEFSTSKDPALSSQENRTLTGESQKKYAPLQVALQRGFNLAPKADMIKFLVFLGQRSQDAIARSKDMEKDYVVARMQAGDDGQVSLSPRKRVKASEISKDKKSAVSALKDSVSAFLDVHGLDSKQRLIKELADFLITELNEQQITNPTDKELVQLTRLYIDDLRATGSLTQQRSTALDALENSIRFLFPEAEDARQTLQNPGMTTPAMPSPTVTTTKSTGDTNHDFVSAFLDIYNLSEIDPESYQMVLQRVDAELTANSINAEYGHVIKIATEIFEENMVRRGQADDPQAQTLKNIIAELEMINQALI